MLAADDAAPADARNAHATAAHHTAMRDLTALLTSDAIAIRVEAVDIGTDHCDGSSDVRGAVPTTAGAVH